MKKMKQFFITAIFLAGLLSCQKDNETDKPVEKNELKIFEFSSVEKQIIDRNNVFAFNLLNEVEAGDADKNVLISPLSASLAIGMLNNGAGGTTQKEIQEGLGYGNISLDELNLLYFKTDSLIKTSDKAVAFETANSIWIDLPLPVFPTFKEVNAKFFDAEAINVDMNNPETADRINKWCEDKTHGKIKDVLNPPLDGVMYLINALYFKGVWTEKFEKDMTKNETFHNADGTLATVPTMQKQLAYSYAKKDDYQAIEIPYGNKAFSMVVVLPDEGVDVSSIVRKMNVSVWDDLLQSLSGRNIDLKMPRFKNEYERVLNDDLQALGMNTMFDQYYADFSRISSKPLYVSLVKQKTAIEVNEEGTEAAAVTVVVMIESAAAPQPEAIPFHINRPFLYFIKEVNSGIIFFAGTVKSF